MSIRSTLKKICIGVLAITIFGFIADAAFVLKFPKRSLPEDKADVVVVLGAAIRSKAIFNRTLKGLRLYEAGKGEKLVLAGGKTSSPDESEAHYMGRIVIANAVLPPTYILDETSLNTYENLEHAKKLVPNATSVLIVSDTYHLPRAVLVAHKVGFTEVYWDSPSSNYYPSADLQWYYFREMMAIVDYIPKLVF